jgi:hypothetical protein
MAKNISIAQLKEILEIHDSTIIKIFNEKLEKLENQLNTIKDENKTLKLEISDLKKSVNFISDKYDKVLVELAEAKPARKNQNNIENNLSETMQDKLAELEDRSRRNNLRINGIEESDNESWEDCEKKVKDILVTKLELNGDFIIERAHRVGKIDKVDINKKNRTVVVKFLNFKDKSTILEKYIKMKLWNQRVYINEDFCERTSVLRKKLFTDAKELRQKGKYAKVVYNKLITRDF